jgi:pimeloyl-ACP methyl ester carboxylesterase
MSAALSRRNALALAPLSLTMLAQPSSGQMSAADMAPGDIIGGVEKSARAGGIDDSRFVSIGGIQQWISVQGWHKDAPILLFLHGGPGLSTIPTAWRFLAPWEEYFTVAQWDQRGTGKTYGANAPEIVAPTMTLSQMVSDAEEVADYLRQTYARRKIVLLGFSWGSILGGILARRHPDWFYAYVGMGQILSLTESDRRGYETTLADARAAGDAKAVSALEGIAPFPQASDRPFNLAKFIAYREQLETYGGVMWRGNTVETAALGKLSPDCGAADLAAGAKGLGFSFGHLWQAVGQVNFLSDTRFELPVTFVHGAHDRVVSGSVLKEWFGRLHAPSKKLVWFKDAAHYVYQEQPARMLVTIADNILPLTRAR